MAKTGPKGPRNTVKQIITLEGNPDYIYRDAQDIEFVVDNEKYGDIRQVTLRKVNRDLIELLKSIPGLNVTEKQVAVKRHNKIPGVISIRCTPTNTVLTLAAPTEDQVNKKVEELKVTLANNGVNVQGMEERCQWICVRDKKKDVQKNTEKDPNVQKNTEKDVPVSNIKNDAVSALVSMGFKKREAQGGVNAVSFNFEGVTAEVLVRAALLKLKPQVPPEPHVNVEERTLEDAGQRAIHESPVTPAAQPVHIPQLKSRKERVEEFLVEGKSKEEIAERLKLPISTIETMMANISKGKVDNASQKPVSPQAGTDL